MRFRAFGFLLTGIVGAAVAGCGGGGSSSLAITQVVVSPTTVSLNRGDVFQLTANAENAANQIDFSATLTYNVTGSVITVSSTGLICAGKWDSTTTPVVCTPGSAGTATLSVTAAQGSTTVTSANIPVNVHEHIDAVTVATVLQPPPDCISQGSTAPANTLQYQATAFSNNPGVCSAMSPPQSAPCDLGDVGTFGFNASQPSVAIIDATKQPANQDPNKITVQAGNPGLSDITATISGVNGTPAKFSTCSPAHIDIHLQDAATPPDTPTSFTVAANAFKNLIADPVTTVDTKGVPFTSITLNWTSSKPRAASVSTAGVVTGVSPGTTSIIASCSPPTCNVGPDTGLADAHPVYSNAVTAMVSGTSAQTIFATTSTAPASGASTNLIPIDSNTAGTAIALPKDDVINSMQFDNLGTIGYMGSSQGLIVFTPSNNAAGTPISSLTGKVLAVSPDGTRVVLSDKGNADPTKRVVYVYDHSSNTIENTLPISGATAAAFSPDMFKLFIIAGNQVFEYNRGLALHSDTLGGIAHDVAVLPSGHAAFVAEAGEQVIATCNNALLSNIATGSPLFVGTTANAQHVVDVTPPNVNQFDVAATGACPPSITAQAPFPHSFGAFVPNQLLMTPDGSKVIILSDVGVLVYHVGATADLGTTSVVPLAGGAEALTGVVTLDSTTVYVGGSDNAVHRLDLTANGGAGADAQQITGTINFKPDIVALRVK